VGNLHWGGTGKTPLTAAVAAHLRDSGLSVAILSRGYGRARRRGGPEVLVVSAGVPGEAPRLGPEAAGDEPVLLASELPGVAVLVAAERYLAGRHALEHLEPRPDLFLLDDGFSHVALARDLDLLTFPAADPFGGGRLAPEGRLREPLASVSCADAALLTGEAAPGDGEALAAAFAPYGFEGPGFIAPARFGPPRTPAGKPLAVGTPVLLVSAVARPEGFARAAAGAPVEVAGELRFPDHHPYPPASLARIEDAFRKAGATAVLTTAKDRVKLAGRLELPLAELPMEARPEPRFWAWLEGRLGPLLPRGGRTAERAETP
jgi:tetraacyldisaccharide 4'-kinase